ncbi:TetR/AcrR family transcriptional regulator [Pseudarthrobacter phenanthrenivorans]|uniref:TetR/AcrR family transcriptional regulator n=1 Tax=Pseudarthrobacter phenanthrenivorans TaxID=361575 RepID=UPI00112652C5|nr:TetR/AcrR family transcriptional regulator [Pseudarthrobacter phenanthrenivorans]TPV52644.1 TetR/AcrR family transcriptional regulator [Pseudarthrobacter phenanthrenivorans]
MTSSKPRGQYAKGAERREQIIQTATDVFATEGFEGTALKRVAELVGVKEATLFHYFRGKQELLTAVLAERDRRSLAAMDDKEASLHVMVRSAERNREEPGLTALYAVASATANDPRHDSHSYFKERYAEVVGVLTVDIERRQSAGEIRSDLPARNLARLAVAVSDGLQLQWLYNKDVNIADGLSEFIDVLLKPQAQTQPS